MSLPLKGAAQEVTGKSDNMPEIFRVRWNEVSGDFRDRLVTIEEVAPYKDANDLYFRMEGPNRAIYAQRDLNDPTRAAISIQTALTKGLADSLQDIISGQNMTPMPDTLTCYSVTNWPGNSGGGSSKSFITAVATLVGDTFPNITTKSTLSPMHGFRTWVEAFAASPHEPALSLDVGGQRILSSLLHMQSPQQFLADDQTRLFTQRLAAFYLTSGTGEPGHFKANGISRVHLANGAQVERVIPGGDTSSQGWDRSFTLTTNFVYTLGQTVQNAADYKEGKLAHGEEIGALRQSLFAAAYNSGPNSHYRL